MECPGARRTHAAKCAIPRCRRWLGAVIVAVSLPAFAQPDYTVYTTHQTPDGHPGHTAAADFACSERVYLVLEARHLTPVAHVLTVDWHRPDGARQESTRHEFWGDQFIHIWVWLQLDPPRGAAIGRVFDPAWGMDAFIGQWQAEVAIDGQRITRHPFRMLC